MVTRKKPVAANRRCAYIFFGVTFLVFWMLYLQTPAKPDQVAILAKMEYTVNVDLKYLVSNLTIQSNDVENLGSKYLVHSSKCKIPSLDPYNMEILPYYNPRKYVKCRNKDLLTYVTKQNNVATLHIDQHLIKQYSTDGIRCCYNTVTRSSSITMPDMLINVSPCIEFSNSTVIPEDIVIVTCENGRYREVYKNVHAVITINEKVEKKMKRFENLVNKEHLSVIFIGIDSISRLNLARSMPKTHYFLQENDWIEFKGYNKIGDNTFPNLMGILTGMNETTTFEVCNPRILGQLDKCNIIWYDYQNLGFVTAYAEDEAEINTFNYLKKGFKHQPTDYYYRSYILATEEHLPWVAVDVVKYCTGPESAGERIFNLARDFTSTFKSHPNFGFFWMNSFSHNEVNSVSRMDGKVVDFLSDMNRTKMLENSIVMFISDHGFRFGPITFTHTGWLEERLPFFYMSLPKWFEKKFPTHYDNLLKNTEKLTTPYDLYMTLQDILVMSGKKYSVKKSSACPKCKSLFQEIETERSCEDAGIEHHWCTCSGYFTISPKSLLVEEAAKFILNEVRKAAVNSGGDFEQCIDFEFKKIISAGISDTNSILYKNNSYFLITFQTDPEAVFQGTVSINMSMPVPVFKLEGSVSRLDVYSDHSWCVNDSVLKKYCYCQGTMKYIFSIFSSCVRYIKGFFH